MFTMPWKVRLAGACAVAALAGLVLTEAASAQTTTFQRYRCGDGTQFIVGP